MMKLDLRGDRQVPFVRKLPVLNADLTDGTFKMEVRTGRDQDGAAQKTLNTVTMANAEGIKLLYADTATIAAHVAAGRLPAIPAGLNPNTGEPFVSGDSVALSLLQIRINETSMEAMPFGRERGKDATLVWDIHVTPSGGDKMALAGGSFIVAAGVTQ